MKKYINYEMCKKCGGQCCKTTGCIYLPLDFKRMNENYLIKEINKGNISISGQAFEIKGNAWSYLPYLRARNKDSNIVDLMTTGGPCKLLTETGCKLNASQRPSLGLLITPTKIGGPCKKEYKLEDVLKWLKYTELLEQLIMHYTNNTLIDQIIQELELKLKIINEKIEKKIILKEMEKSLLHDYFDIMDNKTYYPPEKVKKMHLF